MKSKLILFTALLIAFYTQLGAQKTTESVDSYSIFKRNGGPFGFRLVNYNRSISRSEGVHHNLVCEGWGFRSCNIPFIKNDEVQQDVEELISKAVNDIVNYCILNADDQKCKGKYILKVPINNSEDTTNQQCYAIKLKWQVCIDNCEKEQNMQTEIEGNNE